MLDIEKHFDARSDGFGGVRLTLRTKFKDALATEIDEDGVARSTNSTDENGDTPTESTLFTFGPLLPNQSAKIVELDNGTMQLVLVSPPDEVLGDTVTPNTGIVSAETTADRRSGYLIQSLGGDAKKLAQMNAANKAHYKR